MCVYLFMNINRHKNLDDLQEGGTNSVAQRFFHSCNALNLTGKLAAVTSHFVSAIGCPDFI